jgi:hypothetical protein
MTTMRNGMQRDREVAEKMQREIVSARMLHSVVGAARDELDWTATSTLLQLGARHGDVKHARPAG